MPSAALDASIEHVLCATCLLQLNMTPSFMHWLACRGSSLAARGIDSHATILRDHLDVGQEAEGLQLLLWGEVHIHQRFEVLLCLLHVAEAVTGLCQAPEVLSLLGEGAAVQGQAQLQQKAGTFWRGMHWVHGQASSM